MASMTEVLNGNIVCSGVGGRIEAVPMGGEVDGVKRERLHEAEGEGVGSGRGGRGWKIMVNYGGRCSSLFR